MTRTKPVDVAKKMKLLCRILVNVFVPLLVSGCVYARAPRNAEYPVKLKINAQFPKSYRLLVAGDKLMPYYFDESGKVEFVIPPLDTGCRVYCLGVHKISDHSAAAQSATYVFENEEIIKQLSIRDIERLPLDCDGYRVLKTK